MTGAQIITLFQNIVDDNVDDDFELDLLNNAKNELEMERDWEFLKYMDTSLTWAVSDVYTTAHTLPSGFLKIVSVYLSGHLHPWVGVMMEHRERFKDLWGRYFIDYRQSNLHLCGVTGQSRTITLCYIKATDDLTTATSWAFPAKLHRMLAFKMAEIYQGGVDYDDIAARMGTKNFAQYQILKRLAENWDADLKAAAMNYQSATPGIDVSKIPDVPTELNNL